jgi:hypothetical protein
MRFKPIKFGPFVFNRPKFPISPDLEKRMTEKRREIELNGKAVDITKHPRWGVKRKAQGNKQ